MSATGQGGITLITGVNHGSLSPITIPASNTLVFTHGVNRRAFSVLVTSGDPANYGQLLTNLVSVSQPQDGVTGRYDSIVVSNDDAVNPITVFVSCRWEEPTPELDLVSAGDARLEIEPPPVL